MASKNTPSVLALFLALNLLLFPLTARAGLVSKHKATPNPNQRIACPRDALKLGVCANVLTALLNIEIGDVPLRPCCTVLFGLVDLEAAVCLCTTIKARILGINLNIPVALSLLLSACGDQVPEGFQCLLN